VRGPGIELCRDAPLPACAVTVSGRSSVAVGVALSFTKTESVGEAFELAYMMSSVLTVRCLVRGGAASAVRRHRLMALYKWGGTLVRQRPGAR
jgi:hypothetical protein